MMRMSDCRSFGVFAGEGGTQFVVAGIHRGRAVGQAGGVDHGGAENMAGGEEPNFEAVERHDLVVVEGLDVGGGTRKRLWRMCPVGVEQRMRSCLAKWSACPWEMKANLHP